MQSMRQVVQKKYHTGIPVWYFEECCEDVHGSLNVQIRVNSRWKMSSG